tara:strand:+ start:154 stop:489 length:336 start_codon:yes stop_codon:yes gene_type:complete
MTGFIILGIVLLVIGGILWGANMGRRAQTSKSMGDLLREQNEILDHVEIANEIKRSTPVRGAAQRVQDRWDRSDRSLRDRRATDGGLDAGQTGRRDGETSGDSQSDMGKTL